MIALLRGDVVVAGLGRLVLDVGGVGYEVLVPPGAVGAAVGRPLVLHTHLAVREDAQTLYGFREAGDRDLFRVLLGVAGVGPKVALAALGTLGATRLRQAVVGEDVTALTVVPGIGRKGAQRIVLELRERLAADDVGLQAGTGGAAAATGDARAEVAEALASLGYAPAEVARVLARVDGDGKPDVEGEGDGARSAEALLRAALKSLARA